MDQGLVPTAVRLLDKSLPQMERLLLSRPYLTPFCTVTIMVREMFVVEDGVHINTRFVVIADERVCTSYGIKDGDTMRIPHQLYIGTLFL